MRLLILILATLAIVSVEATEPKPLTDQEAGYDQAAYDECMDSAELNDCN